MTSAIGPSNSSTTPPPAPAPAPTPAPADPLQAVKQKAAASDAKGKAGVKTTQDIYGLGKTAERGGILSKDGKSQIANFVGSTATATICTQQNEALGIASEAIGVAIANYGSPVIAGADAALKSLAGNRDANKAEFAKVKAATASLETTEPCTAKVRKDN